MILEYKDCVVKTEKLLAVYIEAVHHFLGLLLSASQCDVIR